MSSNPKTNTSRDTSKGAKLHFMKSLIWHHTLLCLLFTACIPNPSQSVSEPEVNPPQPEVSIDLDSFVAMVATANCADIANHLYLIDEKLVFWLVEGNCGDASFNYRLFDESPNNAVCFEEESFVGILYDCLEKYKQLFNTIVANLDKSDLGLGVNHKVKQIFKYSSIDQHPLQPEVNIDLDSFLIMAATTMAFATANCADIANYLYIIDEKLMFWLVEGNCVDTSFNYRLFDENPDYADCYFYDPSTRDAAILISHCLEKYEQNAACYTYDSIEGFQFECLEEYEQLFNTIKANLDKSDLGLGVNHTVKQLFKYSITGQP